MSPSEAAGRNLVGGTEMTSRKKMSAEARGREGPIFDEDAAEGAKGESDEEAAAASREVALGP